jgi:gas vesicle protein
MSRMSRTDIVVGVALGVIIGALAVALFLWIDSGSSIDAPSLDNSAQQQGAAR